jgi:hypothetical protein
MPEFCSCGAQLPDDALFCHKCGKAQREIVVPESIPPPEEIAPPVVAPRPELAAPNFRNPVAIRIALAAAALATLMSFVPYLNWLAAGFFAVFFYRRRTGHMLNMESGVRMGWMTGVIMFGMMALLLTISLLFFQAAGGVAAVQDQFKNAVDPRVFEVLKHLQSGPEIAGLLIQLFVFTTLLSMAGGALGAKMTRRS